MYLFSMSHLTIFHCPVVLIEPAYPMNIVRPFCWTISHQILAASPSLFPWKPVWLISSRSSETLFWPTSIAFSGCMRYLFAFLVPHGPGPLRLVVPRLGSGPDGL